MPLRKDPDGIGSVGENLEYPFWIEISIVQMTEKLAEGPEFLKGDPVYQERLPFVGRQAVLEKRADAQEIGY